MFDIQSCYVEAVDGSLEGRVFRVVPGYEAEAIELFRTVVDRCAEKAGRGEDRPEMLGIFVAGDTVQNVISDGTHEPFIAEVLTEYIRYKEATRKGGEPDDSESDQFIAEVKAEVSRLKSTTREGIERDETEV